MRNCWRFIGDQAWQEHLLSGLAKLSEWFGVKVPPRDLPFVVLLDKDHRNEPRDGRLVGEDARQLRAPLKFLVAVL